MLEDLQPIQEFFDLQTETIGIVARESQKKCCVIGNSRSLSNVRMVRPNTKIDMARDISFNNDIPFLAFDLELDDPEDTCLSLFQKKDKVPLFAVDIVLDTYRKGKHCICMLTSQIEGVEIIQKLPTTFNPTSMTKLSFVVCVPLSSDWIRWNFNFAESFKKLDIATLLNFFLPSVEISNL